MSSLAELQSRMTAAIFKGHSADIDRELLAANVDVARRFNIYRNNTFLSLTSHLKAVFPITAKLGDERFFAYAAHEFIRREPPREPRLAVYGAGFPRFLARFPACRGAPILPDMARLEWTVHAALTAHGEAPLDAAALLRLGPDAGRARLTLQPGLGFALSRWRLAALWSRSGEADAPLHRKPTRLGAWRCGASVRVGELPPARFALWHALARRLPLDQAAARAVSRDPKLDLALELKTLFDAGLVIGILPHPHLH